MTELSILIFSSFRFHGRNKEMWWQGDNETRYKYLFALFNNHWQGYAPRNAVDFMKAIQLPFKDLFVEIPLEDKKKKA